MREHLDVSVPGDVVDAVAHLVPLQHLSHPVLNHLGSDVSPTKS